MSPTYGYVIKLFLESEFQHKGNKQMKKLEFSANLAVCMAGTDSENKIVKILHRKGQKNIWIKLSLGQDPTFKF